MAKFKFKYNFKSNRLTYLMKFFCFLLLKASGHSKEKEMETFRKVKHLLE